EALARPVRVPVDRLAHARGRRARPRRPGLGDRVTETITLGLGDVARHLRALSTHTAEAVLKAAHRTAEGDAMRWIQWAIRGGDPAKQTSRVRGAKGGKPRKSKEGGKEPSAKPPLSDGIGQTKKVREPAVAGKVGKAKAKGKVGGAPPYR